MFIELVDNEQESTLNIDANRQSLINAVLVELQLSAIARKEKGKLNEPFCYLTTLLQLTSMSDKELNKIASLCGVK